MPTRPTRSGRRSRRSRNAWNPRTTFLDGSVRSTRRMSRSGRRAVSSCSRASTAELAATSSNSPGSTEIGCAVTRVRDESSPSASHEARNARRQRSVWNPTTSFASRPSCTARTIGAGKQLPLLRGRPGNVDEVRQEGIGAALPHEHRRRIEVVVVEEHGCLGLAAELIDDRVGEGRVHGHVAVLPRRRQLVAPARQHPVETVLREPESGIGDDVVVEVVRSGVVGDEPEPIAGALLPRLLDRAVRRDPPVLVGQRARHPRHVVLGNDRPQRRDEATGTPPLDHLAGIVAREPDGTAVRDEDELPAGSHPA